MRAAVLLAVALSLMTVACSSSKAEQPAPTAQPPTLTPLPTVPDLLGLNNPPCPTADPSSQFHLDVTIPQSAVTLDDAMAYMRTIEGAGTPHCQLVERGDAEITTGVLGIPEMILPKLFVRIWGDTLADAVQAKARWGDEFRRVLDRWDLCDLDIVWELSHRNSDGSSTEYDVSHNNDLADDSFISPGCDKPVVSDEDRYFYD